MGKIMIDKNHKLEKIVVSYGAYEYDVSITSKYSKIIAEFIRQHLYTSENFFDKLRINFYQNFYNIIDSDIYLELYKNIKKKQTHDFLGFKTDVYTAATINGTVYYLCERDHSIIYKQGLSTFVIVDEKYDFQYQFLRVLREYIYRSEEDNGKIFMHAAACAIEDRGFLILGEKGLGKTTLLNYLLECKADYLANDRTFLLCCNSEISIEGFPIPMRISYETINKMSQLINVNSLYRKQSETSDKAIITPCEIAQIYNIKILPKAKLTAVFIPQIRIGENILNVQSISDKVHQRILHENCFTPEDESRKNEWICHCKKSKRDLKKNAREVLENLSTYPTYKIEYGTDCQPIRILHCIKELL